MPYQILFSTLIQAHKTFIYKYCCPQPCNDFYGCSFLLWLLFPSTTALFLNSSILRVIWTNPA